MKNQSRRKKASIASLILAGSIAALVGTPAAEAGTLYWSGNGTTLGGAGPWDTTNPRWGAFLVGPYTTIWDNLNNDTAIFGGSAGAVTLGAPISVGGLQFNTTAYTLTATATNTLSFTGTSNILLNNVAAATITGTIGNTNGNVVFSTTNAATASTLNLLGASTTGWTGTTTINSGMTISLDGGAGNVNQALNSTSGISLNGGAILINGVVSANNTVNYINDTAPISVNGGGSITYRPINAGPTYNELIGAVTVNSGQMTFQTGTLSSGTATLTINTGGITRNAATSALFFNQGTGGVLTGATNLIKVTGAGTTAGWTSGASSNSILGAWAITGSGTGSDYVVYNGDSVVPAATAASAESTWGNATKQYTLSIPAVTGAGASTALTATRNVLALKASSTATNVTSATVVGSPTFTLTGHTLAVGDPVVLGGTAPTNFATGLTYYVASVGSGTFTLAATPGGVPINAGSVQSPNVTTGLKLDLGKNLGTTGILNSGSAPISIGRTATGGQVTLPTAGAGNLFVTPTGGTISIDAPVVDNGGALTLVKSGAGNLFLTGASTFSGGTVLNAGALTVTADANLGAASGGVTFNGAATLSGGVTYNSSRNFTINQGAVATITGAATIPGQLTGSGTLVHSDNSTLSFTNPNNTFTGTITAAGSTGTISFTSLSDAVGAGNINLNAGAFTWAGNTGAAKTFTNRQFVLSGATGTGTINANGLGFSDNLTISQNLGVSGVGAKTLTLQGSNTGANTFAGNIANDPNGAGSAISVTKAGAGFWTISGNMSNTGTVLISGGTLTLSGTNTYSGQTQFSGNPVVLILAGSQAASPNTTFVMNTNASSASSVVKFLDDNSTATFGGNYTLQSNNTAGATNTFYVGNNNTVNGGTGSGTTTGGTMTINTLNWGTLAANTPNVGQIPIQGANGYRLQINSVTLPNASNNAANAATNTTFNPTSANVTLGAVTMATGNNALGNPFLILDGNSLDNRVTGVISNATDALTTGRPLNLTKSNASTWTLSGTNTYTGATLVSGGRLLLTSTGSLASGSAVTVSGGVIGGTGTVNGPVSLTTAGGMDLRDTAVGSFTLGSTLTTSGAAGANNLFFDLGNGTNTTDKITVAGATTFGATAGSVVIHLNQLGGLSGAGPAPGSGPYNLIESTGALTNGSSAVLNTTTAFRQVYSLGVSGNNLQLTTAAGTAGDAVSNHFWKGSTSVWSTAQWYSDSGATTTASAPGYSSNVVFAATAPASLTNTLGADFEINSLTVNSGVAATNISGNMLTIDATADNGNTAGSGITVNNAAGTTIASKVGLAQSQTWTVGTGATLTVSGVVSDFGGGYGITKSGPGTLTLSGANTFRGGVTISAGVLKAGNATALGDSSGAVSVTSGAALDLNGAAVTAVNPLTLNGTGISNAGALINTSATASTYAGLLTLGSDTTITAGTGAINLSNTGVINGSGFNLTVGGNSTTTISGILNLGSGGIIKNGTGSLTLSPPAGGTVSFTGGITVNGGTLTAGNQTPNLFGAPTGTLTFNNTSALSLNQNTVYNPISISASATTTFTSGNSFGSNFNGPITLGSGSTLITTHQNGNSLTFNSVISGSGAFTKNNSGNGGTTFLAAANTFTGNTVLLNNTGNGAFLALSNPLALQNSVLDTTASAASNAINGLRSTVTSLTLGGLSGNKNLTSIFVANATAGYSAIANSVSSLTLNPNASQTPVYSGVIVDGAIGMNLLKTGAGSQTLNAANTFGGDVSISGGTLVMGNARALGFGGSRIFGIAGATNSASVATVGAGATLDLNGQNTVEKPIVLNGTGVGGNGALVNNSGTTAIIGTGLSGAVLAGAGAGYSSVPTVTITGTGTGATATALMGTTAATISALSGGTGFVANTDVFVLTQAGVTPQQPMYIQVTGVASGAITTFSVTQQGIGYDPAGAAPTLTRVAGVGTGQTFTADLTKFTVAGVQITNAGSGYDSTTTYSFGAGGTTAAIGGAMGASSVTLASDSSIGGSGNILINPAITETGGSRALTKVGNGILTLAGISTYTGSTNVNAGTLEVSGSLSGTASVAVVSGATLATGSAGGSIITGTTTAGPAISVSGILSPGNTVLAPMNLTLQTGTTLNFASGAQLRLDLGAAGASDTVAFSSLGNWLSSTGSATLALAGAIDYASTYTVFSNVSTDGFNFASITGYDTVNYSANFFDAGSSYQLNFVAIPEPGSIALILGGLAMLAGTRRRRA